VLAERIPNAPPEVAWKSASIVLFAPLWISELILYGSSRWGSLEAQDPLNLGETTAMKFSLLFYLMIFKTVYYLVIGFII